MQTEGKGRTVWGVMEQVCAFIAGAKVLGVELGAS